MYFFYAILGLIIGGTVAGWGGDFLLGAVGGAMIGVVLAHITRLDRRIRHGFTFHLLRLLSVRNRLVLESEITA